MRPDFKDKLQSFVLGCTRIRAERYPDEKEDEDRGLIWKVKLGKRFVRIERSTPYPIRKFDCFLEIETGEVLKSDLNKPVINKTKRGNIFDEHNGLQHIRPYGVAHANDIKRTT
jgi:hypothetical protein